MRAPPPTAKGVVTIEQIVDTLPDRGRSCWHLGAVWALSQFQDNEVRLGCPGLTYFSASGLCDSGHRLGLLLDRKPDVQAGAAHKVLGPAGVQGPGLPCDAPHKGTPTTPASDRALSCGFLPDTPEVRTKFPGHPLRHSQAPTPC